MNWMMKGKKAMTTVVVVSMLGFVTVSFAAEDGNTVQIQTLFASTRTSLSARIDTLTVKAGESALLDAIMEADRTYVNGTDEVNINKRITKELEPVLAQNKLDAAKLDLQQNRLERDAAIQIAYDAYLLEKMRLGAAEKKLAFAVEDLNLAKAKLKAGLVAPVDLADAEYALEAAKLDVAIQKTTIEEKQLELLKTAEKAVSESFVAENAVVALLPTVFDAEVKTETLLPLALDRDSALFLKQTDVLAAEKRLGYSTEFYKAGTKVYDAYALDLEIAKRDAADALRSKEVAVANALSDLQIAKESHNLALEYVKLMQKGLKQALDRQRAGLAARGEVIVAERQLLDAQSALWSEIVTNNSKEIALRLLVGEPIQPEVQSEVQP